MLQKEYRRTPYVLFVYALFALSNVSAFVAVIWHSLQLVLIESALWLVAAALILRLLGWQGALGEFFDDLKKAWIILPFLAFSFLSIFWSVYWQVSLCRWLILLCTIVTGGYIGLRYGLKEIIRILSILGIFILLVSALVVFLMPSIGVMNYYIIQGAWKGIFWHKNHMGLIASFTNILFLVNIIDSWRVKGKRLWLWILLYLASLLFLLQTDSVAAYLTSIFLHGVIFLAMAWLRLRSRLRRSHYMVIFLVLVLISVLLYLNADRVFGIFNRNTSLTGRIPMWEHLFDTYVSQRPLFGYGFNAFWYLEPHRVEMQQAAGYPDPIVIADNGFIDILVNTGFIGIVLFLVFYLALWWRSIRYAIKAEDVNGFFPLILMSFTLLANISWSLIFENESFFMLVMVSVLFCISGKLRSDRGR